MKTETTEIKDSVEQIIETLPPQPRPRIEFPDPLSQQVQMEAARRGGVNPHPVAEAMGIKAADDRALPPAVLREKQKLDEADAKRAEAEAALDVQITAWNRFRAMEGDITVMRRNIADRQGWLAKCRQDLADLGANLDYIISRAAPNEAYGRVNSAIACERLIPHLEKWIEKHQGILREMQDRHAALQSEYDFASDLTN
jgi:hypothetical protein